MEVIEDGNIMDRIPILLQRDIEYYQKHQTVLSENICPGVVGGRLDFPRNASFAAAKVVLWLEDEFSIAFKQGSGMFVVTDMDENVESGVAKTSDPDKFVQLAVKSADLLLEHLHILAQEALDHADLPVLTATLGAAALLKNSLYCYLQHVEDLGSSERLTLLQSCYKRYGAMAEAVGERVLDLHNRVLSLYVLQDLGGRAMDDPTKTFYGAGTASVQGWWLYMNGSRKDLWNTVPPRMAQRIFAGMLNETLTILTVRYCQTNTTTTTTPLLINDILNILLCVSELLPSICSYGEDLVGLKLTQQARDVRDVHAKCNELFKCMVYRGAEVHYIHQLLKEIDDKQINGPKVPYPWYTFVNPKLFDDFSDVRADTIQDLPLKTALALELIVLLAQPQPSWASLVKVLMMRDCHLSRLLLIHCMKNMSAENSRWPANGLWYSNEEKVQKCNGFLCTNDGYCKFKVDCNVVEDNARTCGALTYILTNIGSKDELKSTLCYALEVAGKDWAACLDRRQVWCDRRPSWLAGILAIVGTAVEFIPPILVGAIQAGASMYQTMSLCLVCLSRSVDCIPVPFKNVATIIQTTLPCNINPVGGSVLLQMLITIAYEELLSWAKIEAEKDKINSKNTNGEPYYAYKKSNKTKCLRIVSKAHNTSSSISFDGSQSTRSSIALAVAEALCYIDEDDKHTQEINQFLTTANKSFHMSNQFGLEDFPDFAQIFEEGDISGTKAERISDAVALTSRLLMTAAGRDSIRVVCDYMQRHSQWIFGKLGLYEDGDETLPINKIPLLYVMFHIGRKPFDQFFRKEWSMPWSKLVSTANSCSGIEGARVHINRRYDVRNIKKYSKNKHLIDLHEMFKTPSKMLLDLH